MSLLMNNCILCSLICPPYIFAYTNFVYVQLLIATFDSNGWMIKLVDKALFVPWCTSNKFCGKSVHKTQM